MNCSNKTLIILIFSLWLPLFVHANPVPRQIGDIPSDDDLTDNLLDASIEGTVPWNPQISECVSEEYANESVQKRGSACRSSVTAPSKISPDLARLERLFHQPSKPERQYTEDFDENCKDKSKPKFLICGGPVVYNPQEYFILNCFRGQCIGR